MFGVLGFLVLDFLNLKGVFWLVLKLWDFVWGVVYGVVWGVWEGEVDGDEEFCNCNS